MEPRIRQDNASSSREHVTIDPSFKAADRPTDLDHLFIRPTPFNWGRLLRIFLLGPMTGALVGLVQATAELLCWLSLGQPDFFFRGWDGVRVTYFTEAIGGWMVGVPYGFVLFLFEQQGRRRMRPFVVIPIVLSLAFVIRAAFDESWFQRQEIDWILAPEFLVMVGGLLVSVLTSRRDDLRQSG